VRLQRTSGNIELIIVSLSQSPLRLHQKAGALLSPSERKRQKHLLDLSVVEIRIGSRPIHREMNVYESVSASYWTTLILAGYLNRLSDSSDGKTGLRKLQIVT